ncbi:unnamed protein product [Peniophora sp. CBMAI 1063]|nr:unnamed protein product [Peniophora sp. CBMAI 1063]
MASSRGSADSGMETAEEAWGNLFRSRFEPSADIAHHAPAVERKALLQSLKIELDALEKYSRRANGLWNAYVRASSLPAEILVIIFDFVRASWKPSTSYNQYNHLTYDLGWIYVSHVCNPWRQAALGTASLWSRFNILSLPPGMRTVSSAPWDYLSKCLFVSAFQICLR